MINPYELLGVSINSSQKDIKRIYYQLSLIMHPDKGGNINDMIALKRAYDFVIKEIECIDKSITIEQLEKNFTDFCNIQEQKLPMFQDIYDEFESSRFNDYFNKKNFKTISRDYDGDGYGNIMEKNNETNETNYIDIENGSLTHNFNAINIYKTPQESTVCQNVLDFDMLDKPINDYSMNCNGLYMSDYKIAFTNTNNEQINENNEQINENNTLEELIKKRENIEFNISNQEYIWSFEGLLNSDRIRIYDFDKLQ